MRILSTILIFAMTYTFAHEAMCHEGPENTLSEWFSHAGPEHRHDEHACSDHRLPQESNHDSDHHDDDSHDHEFRILLVKKDLTCQQGTAGALILTLCECGIKQRVHSMC